MDGPPGDDARAGRRGIDASPYCTVNFVGLFPVPPGEVMEIVTGPVGRPEGTSAVTFVSDTTVNVVATTVPNFTAVA